MASSLISRIRRVGFAVESTKGTAESIAAAMASTMVHDPTMAPDNTLPNERAVAGTTGEAVRVPGAQRGRLSFTTRLVHGDAFMDLLTCCGFTVSGTTTKTATIDVSESSQKTGTFVLWEDGRRKTLSGAAGAVSIEAEPDSGELVASWEFVGVYESVADNATPTGAVSVGSGYTARGMTLTLGGSALPECPGFTLDLGIEVALRQDITSATGYAHAYVSDVRPTLALEPQAQRVADHDVFGKLAAGTAEALVLTVTDAAGATLTISAPQAQRIDVGQGDRDGSATDPITLLLAIDQGDDQVALVATDA
jgi:hypothetical protein